MSFSVSSLADLANTSALSFGSSVSSFASSASSRAEGGVDVDFDATILVQIAFIVLLLVLLKPVLFDPMLKLFEEREKKIDGAKLQARRLDEKSATALGEYEAALSKVRSAANVEKEKLRTEGQKQESDLLADVRKKTEASMEKGRKQIQEDLASRVLGREVG
jgi:F-type H+-transporting ATPase subunit b